LTECAFEYARKNGLTIIPRCPFIKNSFLKKHPEYTKFIKHA
jgi:predicted GNAT family acetyltransferase